MISIHAPREGGDLKMVKYTSREQSIFQSTPPARGATTLKRALYVPFTISIHAPREGGDYISLPYAYPTQISIHAPREGGDFV